MSQLTVEDLSSSGEGVGRIDGKTAFVDGALPGETVEVAITQSKKRFSRAKLLKILTPSPHRITPICPLFGKCGGCQIMHLEYPEQLKWKTQRVEQALKRIGGFEIEISPCIPSPDPLHYRHKIHLHQGGFHKRHSHEIVPVKKCYIHNKQGEKVPKQKCADHVIRTSSTTGEVMQICNGKTDREFLMEILGDLQFKIRPKDFFQINPKQALQLYQKAITLANLNSKMRVLDAYCGVGTLSLFAAKKAGEVVGVESGRGAIQSAKENARLNKIENTQFICAQVEEKIASLGTFDCIFLNPPRDGLDPKVLQAIRKNPPKQLLYISCDPATLSRDLSQLKDLVKIKSVHPFDLFPQTSHVETLVVCSVEK